MAQTGKSSGKSRSGSKKTTSAKSKSGKNAQPEVKPIRREVGGIVCLFLGIFAFIGYFNIDAWFIKFFCGFIKGLIGWGYFIFPPALFLSAFILSFHRGRPIRFRLISALILPLFLGALAHLFFAKGDYEFSSHLIKDLYAGGMIMESGGAVSGFLAVLFESMFSIYGAVPVFFFSMAFFALAAFDMSLARIIQMVKDRPVIEYEPEPEPEFIHPPKQKAAPRQRKRKAIDIPLDEDEIIDEEPLAPKEKTSFFNAKPRVKTPDQVLGGAAADDIPPEPIPEAEIITESLPDPEEKLEDIFKPMDFVPVNAGVPDINSEPLPDFAAEPASFEKTAVQEIADPPKLEIPLPTGKIKPEDVAAETVNIAKSIEDAMNQEKAEYQYPPVTLLHANTGGAVDGSQEIALNRERLDSTLKSFGVSASIASVTRGPTVTRYDLELEKGVKLNKLTNLAGDLALSLGVSSVRIAPIPDKISTVGVEVPNKLVSTVYLRDIIGSPVFSNAASKLSFSIGKDIGGNAIVGNIAKLPHMLIAGTTGSGKSVCMNSLILSLLYKASPEEVKLIMIDPKMVELGIYNGIPHLYIPVVTDPKKAAGALQWSVVEMMKRYRLFSEVGVRDLAGYNAHQKRNGEEPLPQVVIVIDELADLMLVASKEVEESICRVAQMGRASGMHLIIATQRPSADVITGLMKANIPSRIAFAVSSALESRIILDNQGAEKLIGQGDMLYSPIGSGKPTRVQGAFVSDEEREDVINFIKSNSDASYSDEIMDQIEKAAVDKPSGGNGAKTDSAEATGGDYDEMLTQAVEVIIETQQASVSLLQRRLKLGYARAARIVDQMEELGVVGPFEGSKPRQLLVDKNKWIEIKKANGFPLDSEEEAAVMELAMADSVEQAEQPPQEEIIEEDEDVPWDE